jgi:hypothetical protein
MADEITHWLHHPEHGEIPAHVLIDCIFALAPSGRILHFHKEEVDMESRDNEQHYQLNGSPAELERTRCQVIPPFVNAFGARG